jgi:hypothetical protein
LCIFAAVIISCAAKDNWLTRSSPALRPFQDAVKRYLEIRDDQKRRLPKLPDKARPEQIATYQVTLREGIQLARSGAKQGDIFVPPVQGEIVNSIRAEMSPTEKRSVMADNPKAPGVPGDVKIAVNAPYPSTAPLGMVPPALLLRLPALPEELEYRFVGRTLILRDVYASLIVDFIPNALPAGGGA